MNKNFYKSVFLPVDITKKINELDFSNIQKLKAIRFIDLLFQYSKRKENSMFAFVPFSTNLFRKVFNSKYREFVKPLLNANIIQCDEKFSKETGKSMYYRVNSNIIYDRDKTKEITIKYSYEFVNELKEGKFYKGFEKFYNSLEIPYSELYHSIDLHVYNISESNLKVNYAISDGKYPILYKNGETKYQYRDTAIKEACKRRKDLIQDGNKLYVETIKNYIATKKYNTAISYTQSVKNLELGFIYAKRNKTNLRFDHNFTNLPKILMKIIMIYNELGELDATNSQYAILGNMVKDIVHDGFVQDSTKGVLYEELQYILDCDREKAKQTMMKVVYSKPTTNSKEKETIRERYPEFISYVDDYKAKYDYKKLSITMQRKEVEIYVDGVLDKLYDMGINAITKHDSVIFFESDRRIVRSVLDEVLIEKDYTLDIS